MLWPTLFLISLLGAVFCHAGWRRKFLALETLLRKERRESLSRERALQHEAAREKAQDEALFNSMVEGLLVLDKDLRILLANNALWPLFGIQTDLRGKTILEAFRLNEIADIVNKAVVEGQVVGQELEVPGPEPRFLTVNASNMLNAAGRSQGVLLVFHDQTRLRELENTRREFVANVSHELRTPLSLIKGCVETLLDCAGDQPEVVPRFLQTIKKHSDRLTFLIEDLQTISSLESGRMPLHKQELELQQLVQHVLEDMKVPAENKSITLSSQVPEGLLVLADSDRLEQVFSNLVDNAIKYGNRGGKVEISCESDASDRLTVRVRDDGPGIPEEAKERIFERFYRVDQARSRDQGGTGLGLSIVKHIIQSHQGEVWVESRLKEGTCFCFTLPRVTGS